MDLDRINPVTLIAGAATGVGAEAAHALARRSTGGLILVDANDAALAALADELDSKNLSPERVSTLAIDIADAARWKQAGDFIHAQYGRIDWAVVDAATADSALLTLRSLIALMAHNAQGGAIVLSVSPALLKADPNAAKAGLQLARVAAKEGAPDNVRVNAIAPIRADAKWKNAPSFQDLVRQKGDERAALEAIGKLAAPVARYDRPDGVGRLMITLLSDEHPITGATLVVDAGHAL